ncbi:MAG: glutamate--tRNA ligase [Candidatus Yonathbacteria bacterium]|nr:glutamate--tRNA ligase [Candidatus Yonathbacteria bacterium]
MEKKQINQGVRVRFAPSPTGTMHVGTARTALFNFLFAKKHGGKMVLRIEDTDKERSKKEYEDDILEGLQWLSISYDELYRQSERTDVYKKYLEQLIKNGSAYVSKEESSEEGRRGEVIRFKNSGKTVTFHDLIRGDISFDTTELGDFVIAKDLETPLYNFAVVVDDFDMNITHIIRGEDGISNTPRQILIQEALNAPRPLYAHIPFILAPDRSKLSKRHGAVSVTEYRDLGFLSEALVNFLALIGWNPGDEREIFSLEELAKEFSLEKVQKGGAIFNVEKLRWMNKEYLKKIPAAEFKKRVLECIPDSIRSLPGFNEKKLDAVLAIVGERMSTFKDIAAMAEKGEIGYYFATPEYPKEKLLWKEESDYAKTKARLTQTIHILETLEEASFTAEKIKEALWDYATKEGRGFVLWPMRYALSGKDKSPDPFVLADVLGKGETKQRLLRAIEKCS